MDRPNRKLPRLKNFDYRSEGAYFVTICSYHSLRLFGEIKVTPTGNDFVASKIGNLITDCYQTLPDRFPDWSFENFVLMPNHIHMLVVKQFSVQDYSVTNVIGAFKSLVSLRARRLRIFNPLWQKSFHDRIIRNDLDYDRHWIYIEENVEKWGNDPFYSK